LKGLLTYQVIDPIKVVNKIGSNQLLTAITNVSKAELSRVFGTLHMEQISSSWSEKKVQEKPAVLGQSSEIRSEGETTSRSAITHHVLSHVQPIVEEWGVKLLAFQIERINLADQAYAREYEEASLAIAKAKASLRAQTTQNDIVLSAAQAKADAVRIEAEGKKTALIIQAQGDAEARKIEAEARNRAADSLTNKYARDLARDIALASQQVEFARALKATVLTVVPESVIGRTLSSSPMIGFSGGSSSNEHKERT